MTKTAGLTRTMTRTNKDKFKETRDDAQRDRLNCSQLRKRPRVSSGGFTDSTASDGRNALAERG